MKKKIETIQESYGGTANFILIMEDNFTDVSSYGCSVARDICRKINK